MCFAFCMCCCYFVVVVVIVVEMFLPTYFFIGCIQVAGKGTSPFCHSYTTLRRFKKFVTESLPKVTLDKKKRGTV